MRTESSRLIREISDTARASSRAVFVSGLEAGRNPNSVALDIVGRYSKTAKKRVGGIIGLTEGQTTTVQRVFDRLRSGDPADLKAYLQMELRDKRFDPAVRRALREGKPVPVAKAQQMRARYADKALKMRGDTIARTEMLSSLHAGQSEGLQQLIDTGSVRADQVVQIWDATGDSRTRPSHMAMDGQSRPVGQAFEAPSGAKLKFPGDPDAPAEERIKCRCWLKPRIDFLKDLD